MLSITVFLGVTCFAFFVEDKDLALVEFMMGAGVSRRVG
jgi:hypothetical protein